MSAGMKSARSTPLLGLAFLISAITALCPAAILRLSAPSKSRVSTRLSASARMAAKGTRFWAAATSSRLTATIWFRMSDMSSGAQGSGQFDQLPELGLGRAGFDRRAGLVDAGLDGIGDVGRVQGRAGVEDHDVACRAGLVVQHADQHLAGLFGRVH